MSLHPASPPVEIDEPMMRNEWRDLTFLHWDYDPEQVQLVLPDGLQVETWGDQAWVGVVPFRMKVRLPKGPYLPWISSFAETNCRTYVTGPNGEVGVWFFSLEATRLLAVITGRLGYGVRYHWAKMSVEHQDGTWEYRSRRRWPGSGPESAASVAVGPAIEPADITPFQHYLTARWSLFGIRRGKLTFARASHEPWPLHEAIVSPWSDNLILAAGLPTPTRAPVTLWSPGVSVAIGHPEVL